MSVQIGELVWKLNGDTRNFDSAVGKTETGMKQVGTTAGKIKGLIIGAFSAAAVIAAVKKFGQAVKQATLDASDLAESQNAVRVVFGQASDTLARFADTAVDSVGLTRTAFNGLATGLGAQLKQSGLDIDTVAGKTIELTQRAADTASIFNVDVTEALQAYGAALRGEAEPARRFGVNISDAAVQAEALASGLVSSTSEITEQIKVQARLNIIMKQSADYAGDFQNTSGGLANQTRILKARVTEISATFGELFVPAAILGANSANEMANGILEIAKQARDFVQSETGASRIAEILAQIGGGFAVIKEFAGTALFGPLIQGAKDALQPLRDLLSEVGKTGAGFDILGGVAQVLAAGIRVVSVVVRENIEYMIQFSKAVIETGRLVKEAIRSIWDRDARADLRGQFDQFLAEWKATGDALLDTFTEPFAALKGEVVTFIDGAGEQSDRFAQVFADAAGKIRTQVYDALTEAGSTPIVPEVLGFPGEGAFVAYLDERTTDTQEYLDSLDRMLEEYHARERERIRQEALDNANAALQIADTFSGLFSAIGGLSDANSDRQLANIQKQIDAAEEGTSERLALEEQYDQAKKKADYESAKRAQALGVFGAIVSTAQAIIGFLANPGGLRGVALSVLAGITGATQIAAIKRQPLPTFQYGGVVPGTSFTGDNVLARVNSGEEVLTRDDPRHINNQGAQPMLVVFEVDGRVLAQSTVNYINNGRVRLRAVGA